jgi:hypothetical protein
LIFELTKKAWKEGTLAEISEFDRLANELSPGMTRVSLLHPHVPKDDYSNLAVGFWFGVHPANQHLLSMLYSFELTCSDETRRSISHFDARFDFGNTQECAKFLQNCIDSIAFLRLRLKNEGITAGKSQRSCIFLYFSLGFLRSSVTMPPQSACLLNHHDSPCLLSHHASSIIMAHHASSVTMPQSPCLLSHHASSVTMPPQSS